MYVVQQSTGPQRDKPAAAAATGCAAKVELERGHLLRILRFLQCCNQGPSHTHQSCSTSISQ